MYPLLELFGYTISMYWLSVIVGIALAVALALLRRRAARFRTSTGDILYVLLFCIVGALIGAKAFQVVGLIIRDGAIPGFWTLETWARIVPGVGVFYGGLIGGLLAILLFIRKYKLDFWDIADILVPPVLLFHAFGRLGCFYAGCCFGRAAAWGIAFTHIFNAPIGIPLIPVQLFEAGFNLLFMAVLLILLPERKHPGILFPLYLMVYATARFILEFFRGDAGRGILLLSSSQWISLAIIPAAIVLLTWLKKRNFQQKTLSNEAKSATITA